MRTSLRQLDKAFEAIALSHQQLADYFWGDWADSFEGRIQQYPVLVCNCPAPFVFERVTTVLQLNIIVADQVQKDYSNWDEVESDTLQILQDVYRVIRSSPNWQEFGVIKQMTGGIKFYDASPDDIIGWQMTISLKMIDSRGLCDLPLDNYDFNKKITS